MTAAKARAAREHHPMETSGGLIAAFTLPAAPESARTARRQVRAALTMPGLRELAADAEAITSELVANAVQHAASQAHVTLATTGRALVIVTGDSSPLPPAIHAAGRDAESGRGLAIINAITAGQWGWHRSGAGKLVWASLCIA